MRNSKLNMMLLLTSLVGLCIYFTNGADIRITISPIDPVYKTGDTLKITCSTDYEIVSAQWPTWTFKLEHNGVYVLDTSELPSQSGDNYTLDFEKENIGLEDNGVYRCIMNVTESPTSFYIEKHRPNTTVYIYDIAHDIAHTSAASSTSDGGGLPVGAYVGIIVACVIGILVFVNVGFSCHHGMWQGLPRSCAGVCKGIMLPFGAVIYYYLCYRREEGNTQIADTTAHPDEHELDNLEGTDAVPKKPSEKEPLMKGSKANGEPDQNVKDKV